MAAGSKEDPWTLTTPPGSSDYTMYRDEAGDPPALVCQVGSTTLKYHLSAIEDLHAWLLQQGDWVPLGAADENKPAAEGRFGMYMPPLLEALGLAELTHEKRNNSMRGIAR
ncbi:DUF6855 family protein [Arthrobacter sp. MMS18-M83]|uniref:DUF6855 family protein n=1 Tax=Arthrobacter sp. MMS18-M83 TaxID=2996261 RepID=UPI00227BC0DC|nr:hypothetical protein [Arthrobacter sp. MMS18-M83]WAH98527.1 hypothetical protein OW521_06670 [Arthrobacter sp. MMS18-M83]